MEEKEKEKFPLCESMGYWSLRAAAQKESQGAINKRQSEGKKKKSSSFLRLSE